jgi:hypothetical protein
MAKKRAASREDLEGMTKEELVDLAADRKIEVTRGDGEEGEPLKSDYVDALADDGAESGSGAEGSAARVPANRARGITRNGKRLDETMPGGRYINEAGETVDAHGKRIGRAAKAAEKSSEDDE